MKTNICAILLSFALLGAGSIFAQTTATTDPVGFITLNIAGGGSLISPKLSLISPTLTRPIVYQGLITAISTTTITVSGTPWAVGAFNGANGSHYVEIVSTATPEISGTMSEITATPTTSTVTTADNLSVNQAAVGDTVRVRKDVTIADVFGATNSVGLLSTDDPTTSDEVLIYNGANSVSYFYYIGDGMGNPAGWYRSDNFAPSGGAPIAPNEAVVVKRKAAGALTATSVGSVKTGNSIFAVVNGLNVLGTANAQGLTLAASGLRTGNDNTGVKSTDDPSTADEVILYGGASPVTYFFYIGDGMGNPAGWYKADDFAPSGSVVIAAGTSFVVKRKGGPAFNWALPSPTSF